MSQQQQHIIIWPTGMPMRRVWVSTIFSANKNVCKKKKEKNTH